MSNRLNQTKSSKNTALTADVFTGIIEKITGIYVFLMFAVFPLFTSDLYYNLLKDRFYFFFYATLITTVLALMVLLVGVAGGSLRKQKDGSRPLREIFYLTPADKCFLLFLLVVCISTLCSEWVYEAFWGNVGRLQGMLFFLTAGASWFLVTKFFRFKPFYFYVFLVVGLIVSIWGVTDYLGMDILGWRADADDFWSMLLFSSSIGNVNTLTAVLSLYFGAAGAATTEGGRKLLLLPAFFIFSLGLITGASDNAFLAVGAFFALLPFLCFKKLSRLGSYFLLAATFLLAMGITGYLTIAWTKTPVLNYGNWGILLKIANGHTKYCFAAAALFGALGAVLLWAFRDKEKDVCKKLSIFWGAFLVLTVVFVIYCIIDANGSGRLHFLEPYREYLYFTDTWGTNRGYAWRRSLEFFREFGLFKKLFGSGPETYGIFMAKNCYYEMIELMGVVFDSPHSEPIQYLFTTGILGFVFFYLTCIVSIVRSLGEGGYAAYFGYAAIAYLGASLINISVPISTPLFFMALELASSIQKTNEKPM